MDKIKIAVLDDYQQVAYKFANWTYIRQRAEVTVFSDHIKEESIVIDRLLPFDVLCVMRERTPLTRAVLSALPNLKLIVSTGKRNASIDAGAAEELGIMIKPTGYLETGAPEFTWATLMSLARHIPTENSNLKNNLWQQTIGIDLFGKTLGIVGLGRIGTKMASYAKAFNMKVIAWSQNLTAEKAADAGAQLVSKAELFEQADFVTVHLVLSDRTRGIISKNELELMKPSAFFVNTSRGPLVNEADLTDILIQKKIAGAALDVYDNEPLPINHPFRKLANLLATPHIGYLTENTYKLFYEDTVKAVTEWLDGD